MNIPDQDAFKYGFLALMGVITASFRWMFKRQVNRIDALEKKVGDFAPRDAINKELDEIRKSISDSRQEFRDEHARTRKEIKSDSKEIRDLMIKFIEASK